MLTPLAVGPAGKPFPYISGLSLSLGVLARDPDTGEERFARVKVPEQLPRFVSLGGGRLLLSLGDVIAHYLDSLFPGMEVLERAAFRVTRDADMELSDDADDLLEAVRAEIRLRRFGDVVCLEVAASMSSAILEQLCAGLGVGDAEVYAIQGPLDLADVDQIAALDRPELKDPRWVPTTQARLRAALEEGDVFAEIRRADVFVHHPYESFTTSFEQYIRSAATDRRCGRSRRSSTEQATSRRSCRRSSRPPRTASRSVCLVELKARFDERRNIERAWALEQAGVHVVYGFPDLKIHAETTLVVRRSCMRADLVSLE